MSNARKPGPVLKPTDRRTFIAALASLPLAGFASRVQAESPMVFAANGFAINGYDPVSYFSPDGPRQGSTDHALMWKGAIWLFANDSNRERFEMDPWAYAPRYGGYCAYAVSRGYTTSTDPMAWRIHNNQLFLTHDREVFALWERDIPGNVRRANNNWPAVLFR